MSESEKKRETSFDAARAAFEALGTEDRAAFLVEATLSTVGHGLEQAGRTAADLLDQLFRVESCGDEAAEDEPATPKKKAAPRKRAKKSTPKKPSAARGKKEGDHG